MHVKVPMIDTRRIATAPGLVFDALIGGSDTAPLVLMLHGFGVSRYLWNAQVRALAEAGFFAADSLPDDATPGTRRRLEEIAGRLARSEEW